MTTGKNGSPGRNLLLVCACLPQIDGPPRHQSAWQLLWLAHQTHRVHLIAILEDGVRLRDWRQVSRRTDQLTLIGRSFISRRRRLMRQVEAWSDRTFDTVICDDATLWPVLDAVKAERRACDLRNPSSRALAAADHLPPDVMLLRHEEAVEQLADLLQPMRTQPLMPQVMVPPHLTLRRAA